MSWGVWKTLTFEDCLEKFGCKNSHVKNLFVYILLNFHKMIFLKVARLKKHVVLTYSKFEFSHQITESQAFVLGTSINDVPRFLAIFDLPTYLVLLYNVPF